LAVPCQYLQPHCPCSGFSTHRGQQTCSPYYSDLYPCRASWQHPRRKWSRQGLETAHQLSTVNPPPRTDGSSDQPASTSQLVATTDAEYHGCSLALLLSIVQGQNKINNKTQVQVRDRVAVEEEEKEICMLNIRMSRTPIEGSLVPECLTPASGRAHILMWSRFVPGTTKCLHPNRGHCRAGPIGGFPAGQESAARAAACRISGGIRA
jgi:hypothetical protein